MMALLTDGDDRDYSAGPATRGEPSLEPPAESVEPDARPTVLIAGGADRVEALACRAERAGLRCVSRVAVGGIADPLSRVCELDLVLVDLRGIDAGALLGRPDIQALTGRYDLAGTRLAVIVDLDGLDHALALLDAPRTEFLCDPDESDIIALLVMAGLRRAAPGGPRFRDASRDSETMRLEQLSEEVRRLAATIERMTVGGLAPFAVDEGVRDRRDAYRTEREETTGDPARLFQPRDRHRGADAASAPPTHAEIRAMIRARRMRDQFLPADLFADPAWDMILDLMAARLAGQRVSVSSLCIAASVPPTTALRWIRQLTDRAVFARIDDPADGRRVFIELSEIAAQAVSDWVQAVRRNGLILAGGPR